MLAAAVQTLVCGFIFRRQIWDKLIEWAYKKAVEILRFIEEWNPDHSRMGKGITLTDEEVETLKAILNGEEIEDDINEADIL